jgi:hypothetical protein
MSCGRGICASLELYTQRPERSSAMAKRKGAGAHAEESANEIAASKKRRQSRVSKPTPKVIESREINFDLLEEEHDSADTMTDTVQLPSDDTPHADIMIDSDLSTALVEEPAHPADDRWNRLCLAVEMLQSRLGKIETLLTFRGSVSSGQSVSAMNSLQDRLCQPRSKLAVRSFPMSSFMMFDSIFMQKKLREVLFTLIVHPRGGIYFADLVNHIKSDGMIITCDDREP